MLIKTEGSYHEFVFLDKKHQRLIETMLVNGNVIKRFNDTVLAA